MDNQNSRQESLEELYGGQNQEANNSASGKKFSFFALLVKIIVLPLTIASLLLSAVGLLFAIIQIMSDNKHRSPIGIRARYYLKNGLAGILAAGFFFITKKLHSIYKEYTLYAILFWLAVAGIIVIIEPDFYVEFLNMIQELKDSVAS